MQLYVSFFHRPPFSTQNPQTLPQKLYICARYEKINVYKT